MKITNDILAFCRTETRVVITRIIRLSLLPMIPVTGLLAQNNPESKIKYQTESNGASFSIKKNWDNSKRMLRMTHSDEMDQVLYDSCFNRGIKRGKIILATGDKPRFAILYSAFQSKVDPDLVKMGDGRFRITIGEDIFWLDQLNPVKVLFNPSSTEYGFEFEKYPGIKIQLLVSQMLDRGAVARIQIFNKGRKTIELKTELLYGGLRTCNRTFSASYFSPAEKENLEFNQLQIGVHDIKFSDKSLSGFIAVSSIPAARPVIQEKRAMIPILQTLAPGKQSSVYYLAEISCQHQPGNRSVSQAEAEMFIQASRVYYDSLLAAYQVQTPDAVLNSAFKTALVNFDNLYAEKAWLEGIHWWSAYWTNNFQIAAAVSLGQMERARTALQLFSNSSYGPCPILKADGNPDVQSKNGEDGLPYYISNLIRYYQTTGDTATLLQIWPSLRFSIEALWKSRDEDGNGLINWHMGANAFMYQADHLEMPGDAASPSIMMAGMLEGLSGIANQIGQTEDAGRWKDLSRKIYKNIIEVLWNPSQGAFYNHKDEQGLLHTAHYYSDMVFPALYSGLPEIYQWQSLDYLSRSLWMNDYRGERTLMRVGEFKPSIFGNDNVMPVQMAEAAKAYFKAGDDESGAKLMNAVARAATIFTEAPGNFPERMNDEGKGEANYLFGNPVGSFIDAFVSGLFGLTIKNEDEVLSCEPAFPESWNRASLKLPYASVQFRKIKEGQRIRLVYDIAQHTSRKTNFSVSLTPCRSVEITCNNKPVNFQTMPGLQTTRVSFQFPKASRLQVIIKYLPVSMPVESDIQVKAGQSFDWKSPQGILKVIDPQQILYSNSIRGQQMHAVAGNDTGWHSVYIQLQKIPVIVRLKIHVQPTNILRQPEIITRSAFNNEPIRSLDLVPLFNTNRIYLTSRWRNEYAERDSMYFASLPDSSKRILKDYGYSIRTGNSMAMICYGISDFFTTRTVRPALPDSLSLPVNQKLKGLSFLWVCETQARNTGLSVGKIALKYADGSETLIPLTVGENLDASWKYFATSSEPVFLQGEDYAKTYTVPCDPLKELESFSIRLVAADVQIGLLGVNMILPSGESPVIGAIRWDGWFYDTSNFVTQIVQKTMAPKEFHDRLPFFAKEISDDSVYINGSSQEVMDQEISFAKAGGLDYWAFVLYSPGEQLSIAMKNYLQSKRRKDLHFSIITEQGRVAPANTVYLDYIRRLLEEDDYQLVDNGRPLWYLGFVDSANVKKTWGGFAAMKKTLDSIRALVIRSGRENPYLVIMDFNAELGKRWSDSLGGDAISSYVAQKNSIRGTYQQLDKEAAGFWEECKATGASVVPICDAGWSPKPRMDFKNEWTHFYPPGNYYANATPAELADHIRKGMKWLEHNQAAAPAQCLLIYAWNEYDEGGWLGPTLYEGNKRLDALSAAIKEYKQKNR